jgi:hypothetical protein
MKAVKIRYLLQKGVKMQGLAINNNESSFNLSFDKSIFNEELIAKWINLIEFDFLAKKIGFDDEIMELASEIKSSVWKKERLRLL